MPEKLRAKIEHEVAELNLVVHGHSEVLYIPFLLFSRKWMWHSNPVSMKVIVKKGFIMCATVLCSFLNTAVSKRRVEQFSIL